MKNYRLSDWDIEWQSTWQSFSSLSMTAVTTKLWAFYPSLLQQHPLHCTYSKNRVVTLTVIHVILVAFSQGLVTLPCSDMVCWLASCVLEHYVRGSSLATVTTTGIRACTNGLPPQAYHRLLELQWLLPQAITTLCDNTERAFFVLGCELWREKFDSLVKEHIINLWEVELYGEPYAFYPASVSVLGWGSEGWHCGWGAEKR